MALIDILIGLKVTSQCGGRRLVYVETKISLEEVFTKFQYISIKLRRFEHLNMTINVYIHFGDRTHSIPKSRILL